MLVKWSTRVVWIISSCIWIIYSAYVFPLCIQLITGKNTRSFCHFLLIWNYYELKLSKLFGTISTYYTNGELQTIQFRRVLSRSQDFTKNTTTIIIIKTPPPPPPPPPSSSSWFFARWASVFFGDYQQMQLWICRPSFYIVIHVCCTTCTLFALCR